MKKIFLLLAVIVLVFSSCTRNGDVERIKTADMLDITNTDLTFQGCVSRYDAVLSAMKAKVSILENAHNMTVKSEFENEYFLEKDYILTSFEPFLISTFNAARSFDSGFTAESAKKLFELEANGMEITFDTDDSSYFTLRMTSEEMFKEYAVEYNRKLDGFRFVFNTEDSSGTSQSEFLEFIKEQDGVYLIQSTNGRCVIKFNDEDEIVYFCCGELNGGTFSLDESIYDAESRNPTEFWVLARGKMNYINIHTYSDGVLTHEDCSSGPWKSIKIKEDDYKSAFYAQK